MTTLINNKQLMAYTHKGFWQCMDTLRERKLERLWNSGNAPGKMGGLKWTYHFIKNKTVLITGHTGFKVLGYQRFLF